MKIRNPKYPFKQCGPWENCPACFEDFSLTPCTNCGNGFEDEYIEVPSVLEQLTARVRELEEENARLKAECDDIKQVQFPRKLEAVAVGWKKQLAVEQLNNKLLREALDDTFSFLERHSNRWDGINGKHPQAVAEAAREALSLPASTEALDKYVAEKVKEAGKFDVWKTNPYTKVVETSIEQLTKQRDLAVEALEDVRKELQQSNDRLYEEREIWDRVMGDGVKKLERLELELDDCLYVLESLWDKTCNKEVTEKWAGILIRNKRGIGASSAEDSSEQTTA